MPGLVIYDCYIRVFRNPGSEYHISVTVVNLCITDRYIRVYCKQVVVVLEIFLRVNMFFPD